MVLPRGLSAIAIRLARLVPDRILVYALPKRIGFIPGSHVAVAAPSDQPVRLLIGPANFAGQGWQWAHAAERFLTGVSAVAMTYTAGAGYGFPVDQRVPASVYLMSRAWQERQREAVSSRFTHVIVEAARSLFGDVYRHTVADEVRALEAAGLKVALLTHGSDMRVPTRHLDTHEFSPYAPGEWSLTEALEAETARNHELRAALSIPVFVSTPGMLADVPDGRWLPVVVDPAAWAASTPPFLDGVPLVVHAPSSTAVKGTHLIEPVIERLVAEGLVRYERIEGVRSDEVPARFQRADIVLDQFRLGDYGVAACEAMAAGRVVVGNVDEDVRRHVRETTGMSLPIVQADPRTLDGVLRDLVADPQRSRAIASGGPVFVSAVHDGRRAAQALAGFLDVDGIAVPSER